MPGHKVGPTNREKQPRRITSRYRLGHAKKFCCKTAESQRVIRPRQSNFLPSSSPCKGPGALRPSAQHYTRATPATENLCHFIYDSNARKSPRKWAKFCNLAIAMPTKWRHGAHSMKSRNLFGSKSKASSHARALTGPVWASLKRNQRARTSNATERLNTG